MDQVVPALMQRTPHWISVLTNLSADRRTLMRFAALTRGRLSVLSASLHVEFVDPAAFVDKLRWLADQLEPEACVVVNQIVLPGREHQALACRELVQAQGLRWFPQLYKVKRRKDQRSPGQDPMRVADYLVLDKDGHAWACRTAKRHGQGHLGNVFDGSVVRWTEPLPCSYHLCPCTVPANRGMIAGVEH